MFPQSVSNYAQYTHGSLLGFIAAWANWVSLNAFIIPKQYLQSNISSWPWDWAKPTQALMHNGSVSTVGLFVVYIIIIVFHY